VVAGGHNAKRSPDWEAGGPSSTESVPGGVDGTGDPIRYLLAEQFAGQAASELAANPG